MQARTKKPVDKKKLTLALTRSGFLPFEIKEMLKETRTKKNGEVYTVSPLSEHLDTDYVKTMLRARAKEARIARIQGMTKKDYNLRIVNIYRDSGFVKMNSRPDFWSFLRNERDKAIDRGDYSIPTRLPKNREPLTREDIDRNRTRNADRRAQAKANMPGRVVQDPVTGEFVVQWYEPTEAS